MILENLRMCISFLTLLTCVKYIYDQNYIYVVFEDCNENC